MPVTKDEIAHAAIIYIEKHGVYGLPGAWDEHKRLMELVKQYLKEQEEADPLKGKKKR